MHVCCICEGHIGTAGSDLLKKKNNNKKTSLWPSTGSILYILRLEEIGATPRVTLPKYKPKLQGIPNKGKDCRCCCSVAQWYPTLSNPMDCSTPGFRVLHHTLELVQTHVHWVSDAIQPSHPVTPFSSCPQSFPASGSSPMSWLLASSGQSIGASALASVLPVNIQDWFPLGWTGWISLQSKGLSRVFSNTTVQKHQFFSTQPSLWYNSHICTGLLKKP